MMRQNALLGLAFILVCMTGCSSSIYGWQVRTMHDFSLRFPSALASDSASRSAVYDALSFGLVAKKVVPCARLICASGNPTN